MSYILSCKRLLFQYDIFFLFRAVAVKIRFKTPTWTEFSEIFLVSTEKQKIKKQFDYISLIKAPCKFDMFASKNECQLCHKEVSLHLRIVLKEIKDNCVQDFFFF